MNRFSEASWGKFREILGLKESPLGIYYTNDKPEGITPESGIYLCMIGLLNKARKHGKTVYFDKSHFGCPGGGYYMGFLKSPRPKIEYFLSCGIPGEMEGERYVKTPELARSYIEKIKPRPAPAAYCVFKPIDKFQGDERPEIVAFFAPPDILSGLFTLTNYSLERTDGVYTPFGSGCSGLLTHPLKEGEGKNPVPSSGCSMFLPVPWWRRIPCTLSMPYPVFLKLLGNVSESFLQTESWKKVLRRIQKQGLKDRDPETSSG